MISVRRNVFETNSSSTHSMTIVTEDEFTKMERRKCFTIEIPKNLLP